MNNRGALVDKVAIITGGSFGIGRATAIRLVEEGAHVTVLARGASRLLDTLDLIEKRWGKQKAIAIAGDVTQESAASMAFEKTINVFGKADIVISNAGWMTYSTLENTTLDMWQDMIAVNATASFLLARQAFRYWKEHGIPGTMVFVTSKAAQAAAANNSAYSAAKAGLAHLARCLAEEGGQFGIRVNCVAPGAVLHDTALFTPQMRAETAAKYKVEPEELETYYANRSAIKVMLTPEDVAEAILFLCSPRSAKITGATLSVDAGLSNAYLR